MKIILKEDQEAREYLNELIDQMAEKVIVQIEQKMNHLVSLQTDQESQWVTTEEALRILQIGKSKLQRLRNERDQNNLIVHQSGRTILYYKPSLYSYLNHHSR